MADQYEYKAAGSVPVRSDGFSNTDAYAAASFSTTLISAYSSYSSAKINAKMQADANLHKDKMAKIQSDLSAYLSGVALDEADRASAAEQQNIMIGRLQAQGSANLQGAGTGNAAGLARLSRQMRASAVNANNAREAELIGAHLNIAQGRFNDSQAYTASITHAPIQRPNAFQHFNAASQDIFKVGKAATTPATTPAK